MNELDKITGCFLGVAIGDALGAPVEMMKKEDVLKQTNGKGITGFNHNVRRKHFTSEKNLSLKYIAQKLGIRSIIKLGKTTDDWGFTEIIIDSLVRCKGVFDVNDIALAHVDAVENGLIEGMGGTTRDSIKELKEYFDSRGKTGRSPFVVPKHRTKRGSGNGVAMKVAPLVWGYSDYNMRIDMPEIAELGMLTHSDPNAWSAAYAVFKLLFEDIKDYSVEYLIDQVEYFDGYFYDKEKGKNFATYLHPLKDKDFLFGPIENIRNKLGCGCVCTESVVYAIACYLRNPYDFKKGVLEAVNGMPGDCDTNASMAGALIGKNVGKEGIPEEWLNFSPDFKKVEYKAKELYDVYIGNIINKAENLISL